MSHFTVYKTAIGNLNAELLKNAIEFFAKQIGATVFYGSMDHRYSSTRQPVIIGFKTYKLPEGIGFNIDREGNLEICGDAYDQEDEYAKYEAMAKSGMITNSFLIALRAAQNQAPVTTQVEEDRIVMTVQVE